MLALRTLVVRALTMIGVLIVVQALVVVSLGATGYSNRMLSAAVGEELRALRTSLAETIHDPDKLEQTLQARRAEIERSFGLDRPWYARLPRWCCACSASIWGRRARSEASRAAAEWPISFASGCRTR